MPEPREHEKLGRLHVLKDRLQRCGALLTASRRRDEVVAVVGEAASDDAATAAVSDLLDVDEEYASAIVEMPVQSFNKERVSRLEDETSRLEQKVATLSASVGQDGNSAGASADSQ
jgi:DNA gyrase/topoisomerase IV subunit A